ncbi:hypothetical protein T05_7557 [Trichinella murrelli]|uniref:Uncharacterized protein n=1 Tax=Trichinella murrelli TaxID=144512 RepID=A0A0V0UGD1_9BILA|nr:hypothetical protein T05_7557 [Trichinella murrelli]
MSCRIYSSNSVHSNILFNRCIYTDVFIVYFVHGHLSSTVNSRLHLATGILAKRQYTQPHLPRPECSFHLLEMFKFYDHKGVDQLIFGIKNQKVDYN